MGFIFGGNTNLTPEQVASRRRIAEALAASSLEPANSLGGGIAQLGKALAARISEGRLNKQETAGRASADAAFSSLFSGDGDQSASTPADTSSDPMAKYRGIVRQIESKGSGDYSALGPVTKTGDRAYGAFGVMGSNIPAWSREATGREMQPNEFLNDPTSQDAVFNKIFGGYMQGNSPDDAASMWFSGKPLDEAGNATDALGTSAGDYVAKFHALDAGGAGAGSMATGGAGPQISVNQTMGALNNPWLSEGQKSVLGALLKQRLDAQQGFSGTLSPGEVAYQGGREVASAPEKSDMMSPEALAQKLELARAGASKTLGSIPPGYTVQYDTNGNPVGMTPIAGSPAQAAEASASEKAKEATQQKADAAAVVVQDADRAMQIVKNAATPTTGLGGSLMSHIGGTAANDLRNLVDTLKANAAFDRLQAMRNASPTGGALGNVSDTEGRLLAAAIGALDQSQSKEQLVDNIKRVKNIYLDIIHGPENGPPRETLGFEGGLPDGVTEDDVTHTLQLHPEMTREQLLEKLRAP